MRPYKQHVVDAGRIAVLVALFHNTSGHFDVAVCHNHDDDGGNNDVYARLCRATTAGRSTMMKITLDPAREWNRRSCQPVDLWK